VRVTAWAFSMLVLNPDSSDEQEEVSSTPVNNPKSDPTSFPSFSNRKSNSDSQIFRSSTVTDVKKKKHADDDNRSKSDTQIFSQDKRTTSFSLSSLLHSAKERMHTYFSAPLSSPHKFTSEVAFLSGQLYDFSHEHKMRVKQYQTHFKSKIWITYRKNFPQIEDSLWTTDAGWGCMIRSMQMLLADSLVQHFLGKNWRYRPNRRHHPRYSQILRWFFDDPSAEFSIHRMLEHAKCFKKTVGTWYGPSETAFMVEKCVNNSLTSLHIVNARDGILYKNEIEALYSKDKNLSILMLIPVRLGLDELQEDYHSSILHCLQFPQSIGIAGGIPKRSLYFPGFQGQKLLYLDPHFAQTTPSPTSDIARRSETFHYNEINSLCLSRLDPCMCFGFYCRDQKSFNDFWKRATKHICRKYPIFSIESNRRNLDDLSIDEPESLSS